MTRQKGEDLSKDLKVETKIMFLSRVSRTAIRGRVSLPSLRLFSSNIKDGGEVDIKDDEVVPEVDPLTDYGSIHKSGTPSPWAVFDAWGAGDQIEARLSDDEVRLYMYIELKISDIIGGENDTALTHHHLLSSFYSLYPLY